jgi:LPS export ABC transporter permease LptG/LPS export ABC transporter permease LptF
VLLKTLDRYVIREIVPPFLLAVLIFTFLLQLPPLMEELERLVSKGVSWSTVGFMLVLLVPQALGLTIPMGLLVGILIGLGRLSGDREGVALLACGVSPYRLLRPIMLFATVCTVATFYVMVWAIPDSNQRYRLILYDIIAKKVEADVRPRVFFEEFPNWVLFPRDEAAAGQSGWKDLLLANTSAPGLPVVYFAERGQMVLSRAKREVIMVLSKGTRFTTVKPGEIETSQFGEVLLDLEAESVFPPLDLPRGVTEKTIAELRSTIAQKDAAQPPISTHNEIMAIHAKFSIPIACLVFALIGLALGLSVARDNKFSGFVVGIAVIFIYYMAMFLAESAAKGHQMPASLARWVPNLLLGPIGAAALVWRARYTEGRLPFRIPMPITRLPAWLRPAAEVRSANAQDVTKTKEESRSAPRPRGVVIVVRIPKITFPGPVLIDRYVSRIYLRIVGLSFLSLLTVFYISTFIDKSDKVFKGQTTFGTVLSLLFYMTPQFVYYIIPIAALLSVLVTFGLLARSSELTVMKACGISLYRASASLVLLALVLSAVLFGLEQKILARSNRQAEILDSQIRGRPPRTYSAINRRWVLGRDGAIYHYGHYDPDHHEMNGLTIYEPRTDRWALASQTYMKRAAFVNGIWQGQDGWHLDFSVQPPRWTALPRHALPDLEPPDYFATEQPLAEMMTVGQLREFIAELSSSGLNHIPWAVELQRKLAFPFVTLVMTLLAVPFGVSAGRRGTLYGIGLGIVLALSYWILSSAFVAIGRSGVLTPFLAGWAPNILTLGVAGYLLLRART